MTTLYNMGVVDNTKYVYKIIRQIHGSKGEDAQKLESLLKQVHYSQLINFDFKFSSKSTSSILTIPLSSRDRWQHDSIKR